MDQGLKQNGFYYANFLKSVDGENRLTFLVVFRVGDYLCMDITPSEESVVVDQGLIEHIKEWKSLIVEAIKDGSIDSEEAKEKFAKCEQLSTGVLEGVFKAGSLYQKLTLTSAFNKISASLESKGFRPLLGKEVVNTIFSGLLLDFQETEILNYKTIVEKLSPKNTQAELAKPTNQFEKNATESFFEKYSTYILPSLIVGMLILLFVYLIFSSKSSKYSDNDYAKAAAIADSVVQDLVLNQDSIIQASKYYEDSIAAEANKARERILGEQEARKAEMRKTSSYMEEYSEDFPFEYHVPSCPNQAETSLPSGKCWLVLYYAKPGNQNWQEVGGTIVGVKAGIDNTFHFFGKKGWKYAYSWDAGNSRPIKLKPINVKQTWSAQ